MRSRNRFGQDNGQRHGRPEDEGERRKCIHDEPAYPVTGIMKKFMSASFLLFSFSRYPDEYTDCDEDASAYGANHLCHLRTLKGIAELLCAEVTERNVEDVADPHTRCGSDAI